MLLDISASSDIVLSTAYIILYYYIVYIVLHLIILNKPLELSNLEFKAYVTVYLYCNAVAV